MFFLTYSDIDNGSSSLRPGVPVGTVRNVQSFRGGGNVTCLAARDFY